MGKYIIDVEEFLQNEEFVQWVINPTPEGNQYWDSWMRAHPESKANMLKAKELLNSIHFKAPKSSKEDYDETLEKILRSQRNLARTMGAKKWHNRAFFRIAAGFSILAIIFYLLTNNLPSAQVSEDNAQTTIVKETIKGVKMQTALPDGSKVWLNANSKLTYTEDYSVNKRIVHLTGEAFFEVQRDTSRQFIVQSGQIVTEVLGTSFNVRAKPGSSKVEVALVSGKAAVRANDEKSVRIILEKGEKAVHNPNTSSFAKDLFDYEKEIGWKDGILFFDKANFNQVKERLENWYGVTIHTEEPVNTDWNYSGKFENQNLELVLERIAFTKGFEFEILERNVYLDF